MLIEEFINYMHYERNFSPRTLAAYQSDLRQWSSFATCDGKYEFSPFDVGTTDLRQWVAHLSGNGIGARSIRRKISTVSAFYRFLMKRHGLKANPAADLQLARPAKKLPSVITEEQTARVLSEDYDRTDFAQVRDRLIVEMLYETGMRASELVGLIDANVNTEAGSLKVRGKRNKERIIPFGQNLKDLINLYRGLRADACAPVSTPALFVNIKGQGINYAVVNKAVHAALDGKVTAARRSPHVLRHSFATDMLNHGADLNSVKALLGHQSLETTQIYTHISASELQHNYQLAHPRALKKGGPHGS